MLNTVKDIIQSIGSRTDRAARRVGHETSHLAKRVGHETSHLAQRVGHETSGLAHRVGPRRGIIGLVTAALAIGGGIMLVRYLRSAER